MILEIRGSRIRNRKHQRSREPLPLPFPTKSTWSPNPTQGKHRSPGKARVRKGCGSKKELLMGMSRKTSLLLRGKNHSK
jgi:hypothetical protein